jgi:hypothetical protein
VEFRFLSLASFGKKYLFFTHSSAPALSFWARDGRKDCLVYYHTSGDSQLEENIRMRKKKLSLKSGEAAQETLLLASESSDCGILCIIINSDVRKLPVQLAFMALSTGLDTHRFCPFSTRLSAVLIAEATVN